MWTDGEREQLTVWADDLQQRGDPWGELVATSLALSSPTPDADEESRLQLFRRMAELERDVLNARIQPLIGDFDEIRPFWKHGALVGLRVMIRHEARMTSVLDRMAALLRLPAARFLWLLRIDGVDRDRSPLALLLEPEIVARPRVLILGHPIAKIARQLRIDRSDPVQQQLASLDRNLLDLTVFGWSTYLPWANGDETMRRGALAELDARVRSEPDRLSPRDRTLLTRALFDEDAQVQLAALDCVETLGLEAAALIPELALIETENPQWRHRADTVLARFARRRDVVARVADNFLPEQIGAMRWLATVDELDTVEELGLRRLEVMQRELNSFDARHLGEHLRQLEHRLNRPRSGEPRAPALRGGGWWDRLRSWWAR